MGRTLKRVPMDFQWPKNKRWKGYVNPYSPERCDGCGGSGYNPETKKLYDAFYGEGGDRWDDKITEEEVAYLIREGRLFGWTHSYNEQKGRWVPNGKVPTADEVNAAQREMIFMNCHDAINHHALTKFRAKKMGIYGKCQYCEGHGDTWPDADTKRKCEIWSREDPPKGDGYQLWETTSEGSPISPVFKSLDDLCEWAEKNATTFGNFTAKKEEWKQMLSDDMVFAKQGKTLLM